MSAPSNPPPTHKTPRVLAYVGFALFLAGMALVAYVFLQANTLLSAPPPPVPQVGTGDNAVAEAGVQLGAPVVDLLKRLLILLVMCVAASVFASQGIRMLFATWNTKVSE